MGVSSILSNLGTAYSERTDGDIARNMEQAISYFQRALQFLNPQTDTELYLDIQNGLGSTYARVGYARNEYLQRSIECYQEILGVCSVSSYPKNRVWALLNLGATLFSLPIRSRQNNLLMAKNYLEEAINLCTIVDYPEARNDQGKAWANLAGVFLELHDGDRTFNLRRAINCVKSAMATLGVGAWDEAALQSTLGLIYTELAQVEQNLEYLDKAKQCLEDAVQSYEYLGGTIEQIRVLNNLAGLYRTEALVRTDKRQEAFKRASNALNTALGLCDFDIHVEEAAMGAKNLGDLYFQNPSYLENPWKNASKAYFIALDAREKLYHSEGAFEARQVELRHLADIAKRCAYCLARAGEIKQAVEMLEQSRARTMAFSLSLDKAWLDKVRSEDQTVFEQLRSRIKYLESLDRQQAHIRSRENLRVEIDLSAQLREARLQLDQFIEKIRTYVPEFMSTNSDFQNIMLASDVDQVLLYILPTISGGLAIVVPPRDSVLTTDHVVWLDGLTSKVVEGLLGIGGLTASYLGAQMGQGSMKGILQDVLTTLGDHLAPLVERLDQLGCKRCVFVPLGLLSLLPLHAARLPETDYIDQKIEITYAPSARMLHHTRRQKDKTGKGSLVAVSNPSRRDGRQLLFSQLEVDEISRLFPKDDCHVFGKTAATWPAVTNGLSDTTYVHFACHGVFRPSAPLRSSLLLTGDDEITIADVLNTLSLSDCRLAVLSACQTAIGDFVNAPDEALGFPASFLQAGVTGVLGSLWPVNDFSTALLMIKFYEYHLCEDIEVGKGPDVPASALHKAQLWLRGVTNAQLYEFLKLRIQPDLSDESCRIYESALQLFRNAMLSVPDEKPFADPYYWAAFAFYGI